jgi:hypothetical protein
MMDTYFVTDVPRSSKKVIKKALDKARTVCTSFCASAERRTMRTRYLRIKS